MTAKATKYMIMGRIMLRTRPQIARLLIRCLWNMPARPYTAPIKFTNVPEQKKHPPIVAAP
jgi:hypothetical protein